MEAPVQRVRGIIRARVLVASVAAALVVALAVMGMDARAAGPARVVKRGPAIDRTVALTFDDGWHPARCEAILDILLTHGVPATWFPNAVYLGLDPALWARIADHHPIGNHTVHHHSLPGLSERRMRQEIVADVRRVEEATGKPMSKLLRPPYGAHDRRVRQIAADLGYETLVLWDVDSRDTVRRVDDQTVARAASRGGPGSIVLMHCGPPVTPRVLPSIIASYACEGYRFATVEGLLAGQPGVAARVDCPPRTSGAGSAGLRDDLEGREWRLVEADAGDGLAPVPADAILTLRFGPRRVAGHAGCSAFETQLSVGARGSLRFGPLMRDPSGCDDGRAPSSRHLDLLMRGSAVRIVDGALEVLDRERRPRLRFRVAPPMGLAGDWTVASIAGTDGILVATDPSTPLTIAFGPGGTLRGWSGCDTFVGGYGVSGDTVTVGPVLEGDAACIDEREAREGHFLAALRSVARWVHEGGVLRLQGADGRVVLELVPREAP